MLKPEKTALLVVDVQGKLAQLMHGKQVLFENLQKMRNTGVTMSSTEMALFELLEVGEGERFKEILKIVK